MQKEGVFYGLYQQIKEKEDFVKPIEGDDLVRLVIYFDDQWIDQKAEKFEVLTRLKRFECLLPF